MRYHFRREVTGTWVETFVVEVPGWLPIFNSEDFPVEEPEREEDFTRSAHDEMSSGPWVLNPTYHDLDHT
jgi:hypothetical protein